MELATKFGATYAEGKREVRGDPAYVRLACEASLKRLDVACIVLYYQHRVDTHVPIEITVSLLYNVILHDMLLQSFQVGLSLVPYRIELIKTCFRFCRMGSEPVPNIG